MIVLAIRPSGMTGHSHKQQLPIVLHVLIHKLMMFALHSAAAWISHLACSRVCSSNCDPSSTLTAGPILMRKNGCVDTPKRWLRAATVRDEPACTNPVLFSTASGPAVPSRASTTESCAMPDVKCWYAAYTASQLVDDKEAFLCKWLGHLQCRFQ